MCNTARIQAQPWHLLLVGTQTRRLLKYPSGKIRTSFSGVFFLSKRTACSPWGSPWGHLSTAAKPPPRRELTTSHRLFLSSLLPPSPLLFRFLLSPLSVSLSKRVRVSLSQRPERPFCLLPWWSPGAHCRLPHLEEHFPGSGWRERLTPPGWERDGPGLSCSLLLILATWSPGLPGGAGLPRSPSLGPRWADTRHVEEIPITRTNTSGHTRGSSGPACLRK